MRKFLLAVAFLLLVGTYFHHVPYERMLDNTVMVVIYDKEGNKVGHGSGAVLDDGYILTAGHITKPSLANEFKIKVFTRDGEDYKAEIVKSTFQRTQHINSSAIESDLGLLKVDWDRNGADIDCNAKKVGTSVFVSGNPANFRWAITQGNVISVENRWNFVAADWIKVDAVMVGGNSGGPIFDRWGNIIGIVSHGNVQGFGVPVGLNAGVSGPAICYFTRDLEKEPEIMTLA